jgi:hypothetical protein
MTDPAFPAFMNCEKCGARCRVKRKDVYEMPEGVAGVAWARFRKCREYFVHFVGEQKAAAVLMERWLDVH